MLEECVPVKPRSYYKRAKMYTIISAQGSKAISSNYRLQKTSSWSEISSCLKGYNFVFYQSLLPGDQNWWNSKKHVNWQYEESVLSYCLTGICTWATVDTSPGIFANNEFQGFVPSFTHCRLSRRGFPPPPRNGNLPPTRKCLCFWSHWLAEDKLDQLY